MSGIGPLFEAYESPVLPLNYTDKSHTLAYGFHHNTQMKRKQLIYTKCPCGHFDLVAGDRIARPPEGYEPSEILLLHPAIFVLDIIHY